MSSIDPPPPTTSDTGELVVFLSGDLIFASRVRSAAAAAGLGFQLAGNVPTSTENPVRFLILDLSTRSGAAEGLMATRDKYHANAEVIAYAPHVQIDRIRAARQHGIPTVLTRGQFNDRLPTVFVK